MKWFQKNESLSS